MSTVSDSSIPPGRGRQCILLLSGGLDSTTLLAALRSREWDVSCLTFRYGQRHELEIGAAGKAGRKYGGRRHVVFDMPLSSVAASALTSDSMDVPPGGESEGIPVTYVPARNLAFLSVAISWAESLALHDIFIAVSSVDFSGYPDCRQEFIRAFEEAAALGTKAGVEGKRIFIHAPFQDMSKAKIIELGLALGVDYAATHTCYNPAPDGSACGACDACLLRREGFKQAGAVDPLQGGDGGS